ncbi:efflux RND transporter permease subunit, partial [bacterium]|nr:efflux RND transporter permease subunit [bacterium]
MTIAEFSIRQRVFANMATVAVLVMGFVCARQLRREIFPSISTDYLMVQTLDVTLNAPEDVERLVTVPIEDRVRNVEEVKEMNSVSAPNQSFIYLELQENVKDVQRVLNEVRQEVDQAKSDLPRTAEAPVVQELKFPFPVITVGMTYAPGADRLAMKKIADELEDRFLALPGIASVVIAGLSDRELWVEVDPYRAQGHGVSLDEIGAAVRAKNQNIPGGKLESESGEFTLRTLEQVDETTWRGIEDVVIKRVEGQTVRVRDVATVRNTFEKDTTLGRVNGRPAITFTINKQKNGDTIRITDEVKNTVAALRQRLPAGVQLDTYNDTSKFVRERLSTMIRNGIQSLVLVLALLLLFINWRIALMVTLGLVFSFFGAFIYLYFVDNSFNMISLFALILVLGMLVDDAVVVCENVYRYIEMGCSPHRAAIAGATEMLWPVVG